ncbi:DNA-deoxyinosine glycosylase [Clostridium uliginosum]|uniref:Hypoxanthine-DNA glycosylase n=1 Tax=Clostridium uliginosum TaxID=119641 RepID=A0A1I1GWT6_9CLOT|nr:DNA-deoxyinosine glycosylase [Clostridium uliginosum]SFC16021.1 hypoxanthine-DNA glycosylase [Clostridium uliginosum]
MSQVIQTLEPIYDGNSKILILGTFPSVKSREAQFYYQNPRNRFWKVISEIVQCKEYDTTEQKKSMLTNNKMAVWDVIESCEIKGSSDSSIKNVIPADLTIILDNANIEKIYANGDKAFKLYMKYTYPVTKREIIKLPSTSPANAAFSLERLIKHWEILKDY